MASTDHDEKPYCDLVMKGGITSGVIYPRLIAKLSASYRFKNVGGTSAGAIAAAGCVAAEFGRRQTGSQQPFDKLAALPGELGAPVGKPKASMLLHLFQPSAALKKHFAVLLGALNKPDKPTLAAGALAALLRNFNPLAWLAPLLVLAVLTPVVRASGVASWPMAALATAFWLAAWVGLGAFVLARRLKRKERQDWLRPALAWWLGGALAIGAALALRAGLPLLEGLGLAAITALCWAVMGALGLALAVGLSAGHFAVTLLRGLHGNRWGICSGLTSQPASGAQGLTDWLYAYFNELAGLKDPHRPLCFGDLWAGRLMSDEELARAAEPPPVLPPPRALNLQVMTTAVSQQMCYSLPWRDNAPTFYFEQREWEALFPKAVVEWLVKASRIEWGDKEAVCREDKTALVRLPSSRFLPIVVAVRMSLSFPVLLSAVPLYSLDFSESPGQGRKPPFAKRVWFSDGGIASNMPMHFFDAPLPGHPTFAINLKPAHPLHPIRADLPACDPGNGRVYLPSRNSDGLQRYWAPPDDASPLGLFSFIWGIVETMQNWRDEIQFPYPGYRDRIVQISQLETEGGLNLDMPAENIETLGLAGECAAQRLLQTFLCGAEDADGWHNHRQIRFRTFLGQAAAFVQHPSLHDAGWDAMLDELKAKGYTLGEVAAATSLLMGLRGLGAQMDADGQGLTDKAPRPHASLKIAPKI